MMKALLTTCAICTSVTVLFQGAASADPPSFKLMCDGGPGMRIATNHDVPAPGHIGAIAMFIYFKAGQTPARPGPSECVWVDRTFRPGEPEVLWIKSPRIEFAFQITGDGRVARDTSGPRLNVDDNTPEAQDWDYLVKGVLEGRAFSVEVFNAEDRVMQITHVDR